MEEVKGIVEQVIQKLQHTNTNKHQQILSAWQRALPVKDRNHCAVVGFRNKCLVVHVDSSGQLYQFNLEKQSLIKNLNKRIKKDIIEDIYFRIGKI